MHQKLAFAMFFLLLSPAGMNVALAQSIDCALADNLSLLEIKFFAHSYDTDLLDRTARLERFMFGEENKETPLTERIAVLVKKIDRASASLPPKRCVKEDSIKSPTCETISCKYPRVSNLEQRFLGGTFESQPLQPRLERLEVEAFGKPSSLCDLAARVDAIEEFHSPYSSSFPRSVISDHRPTKLENDKQIYSVVDQIESLELMMFGRTRPNKKLAERVNKLEKSLYGSGLPESNGDITMRVSQLGLLHGSDKAPHSIGPAVQSP